MGRPPSGGGPLFFQSAPPRTQIRKRNHEEASRQSIPHHRHRPAGAGRRRRNRPGARRDDHQDVREHLRPAGPRRPCLARTGLLLPAEGRDPHAQPRHRQPRRGEVRHKRHLPPRRPLRGPRDEGHPRRQRAHQGHHGHRPRGLVPEDPHLQQHRPAARDPRGEIPGRRLEEEGEEGQAQREDGRQARRDRPLPLRRGLHRQQPLHRQEDPPAQDRTQRHRQGRRLHARPDRRHPRQEHPQQRRLARDQCRRRRS